MALSFTQGDNVVLNLNAQDGNGNPINITGATFSTQIMGPAGVVATFGNSQHAITNAALGQFTLTLAQADTNNCAAGPNKDIITGITISGVKTTLRGIGILTVYGDVPSV